VVRVFLIVVTRKPGKVTGFIIIIIIIIIEALRNSPSARCVIAANEICRFLDIFGKNIVSFEDTFSILEGI
jgi:hypothetical protein